MKNRRKSKKTEVASPEAKQYETGKYETGERRGKKSINTPPQFDAGEEVVELEIRGDLLTREGKK